MVLVIIKALDIMELVAQDQERAYTLTEISERLDLNQATCANILKTLVSKNYIEHLGRKKGYKLGPMAFNLTNNLSYNQNLIVSARDVMEALTLELNETSLLGILRNQKRYILHIVHSDQDLQVRSRTERNVYETATGRLLLAHLAPKERENFIQANGLPPVSTWKDAATLPELEEALDKIKAEGFAFTLDSVKHIVGLAAPIRKESKVIAALSIFLPESRYSGARKKLLMLSLKEAADKISERMQQ
ncbi:IclR family transcriptional regulator [Telluribacter sp.]|jgi:DNA-binding IclR family transcriptional regulator|uniref:IclR family transcriptional regulator n=1 Tax=Telluribacter sp. TaxID=1978767 RepID=UPI002E10A066|nr:IclR family transcriptional regulator [Telluribacter sp.]